MVNIIQTSYTKILSFIGLTMLLVSCIQSDTNVLEENRPTESSKTTIEETSSPPDFTPQPSFLVFDHISGDAGNFYLLAGATITFTWDNPPEGADSYEFVFVSQHGESPVVVGSDLDVSDGVSVSWTIPENIAGELRATAFFPDNQTVNIQFPPMIYSGNLPPTGVCTLIARNSPVEVYRLPDRSSEVFAQLIPGVYAPVLEIAPDEWYRIDASVAEEYTSPRGSIPESGPHDYAIRLETKADGPSASGEGWVNTDKGISLVGDCSTENLITTYYFLAINGSSYPEGAVVIMPDTFILAPTHLSNPYSTNSADDLSVALQAVFNDSRNGWVSDGLEIVDVNFEVGHATVILQGDYFGVGDVTMIAARMQILLTVFANPAIQTATVSLNGDTIGNLGVSTSMGAKPADYVFTRAEIDTFITENAFSSP